MNLQGSIVAIVTPFKGGKIDTEAYRRLIEFQIEGGTSAIVPCGTTGESATLSHEEHEELVRLTVELVAKRVPVIAGTGSNSTAEAVRLTVAAGKAGADGALLIAPYYNKPTQEGIYQHYKAVAEASAIPLVLYNLPGRTAINMAPETCARLGKIANIVAMKDATDNIDWTSEVIAGGGLTLLSGNDSQTLPMMALGAKGVISVLANIAPRATADLVAKALAGDWDGARAIHFKYYKLIKSLFLETNPIPVKAALAMMGIIEDEIRLPLVKMSDAPRAKLREAMVEVGLLK